MLALLRHSTRNVFAALIAGLLLRLWFIHYYPVVEGDSLVYGELARNWFWHGIYGFTRTSGIHPTLIRLPGYPLFLALCFYFFGVDHYTAILSLQAVIDLCTCLLVAGFATRMISHRAGIATLYVATLCPFTANFVSSPLTETLTLFCIASGLYSLARLMEHPAVNRWLLGVAFSISYAAMLRPDGVLFAVVMIVAIFWYARRKIELPQNVRLVALCMAIALLPFVPWAIRNARIMHTFQPLAPRYANDPNEFVPRGWIRWVKSWTVDYASTAEIYWNVNDSPIDIQSLPSRAFDSAAEKVETEKLFAEYNQKQIMTWAIDAKFAELAKRRIAHNPFRFYVELPLMRLADMWLRPRTDQLWIELRWWQYRSHRGETIFSYAYAALNVFYLLLAILGLKRRVPFAGVMIAYVALRCLLLMTLEAPESRYTLECFPMIFILAGATLAGRKAASPISQPPVSSSLS